MLVTWLAGGRAHLATRFSPRVYWEDIGRVGATFTCFVETILHILRIAAPDAAEANNSLRLAVGSGAPEVRDYVTQRLGISPYFCYGSTETGVPVVAPIDLPPDEWARYEHYRAGARFAGWSVSGCRVKISGEGDGEQEGTEGEILVKSPGMLRRYWRDPAATEAAFVDGWFRSGDQGLRGPDGSIYFVDRLKDLVRRGGENIACREIEDVLMRHPDVVRAAVVSVADPVWTEEAKAVVVTRDGVTLEPEALWGWCAQSLADFKIPRYIEYRPDLPVSASGKVQKAILRQEGLEVGRNFDRKSASKGEE
jgi:acyl-CoA synthetase (AMP-forming)/AMP-acid ligase II